MKSNEFQGIPFRFGGNGRSPKPLNLGGLSESQGIPAVSLTGSAFRLKIVSCDPICVIPPCLPKWPTFSLSPYLQV